MQAAAGISRLHGDVCEQIGDEYGYRGGFAAGIMVDRDGTLWVKTPSRTSSLP